MRRLLTVTNNSVKSHTHPITPTNSIHRSVVPRIRMTPHLPDPRRVDTRRRHIRINLRIQHTRSSSEDRTYNNRNHSEAEEAADISRERMHPWHRDGDKSDARC